METQFIYGEKAKKNGEIDRERQEHRILPRNFKEDKSSFQSYLVLFPYYLYGK
jgi:hypothetical protein